MTKKFQTLIAKLFTIIYISFLALSCVNEVDSRANTQGIREVISKRLSSGDYSLSKPKIENPYKDQAKKATNFIQRLNKTYRQNRPLFKNASFYTSASFNQVNSETELISMGIDVGSNYDLALNELTDYYNTVSPEGISNSLAAANNLLTNYSLTSAGAEQFLLDCEASGSLTYYERQIIQDELTALQSITSKTEALAINTMVEQEILQSSLSENERAKLLMINALIESLLINDSFITSLNFSGEGMYHKTGMAALGVGLFIAGAVLCVIATAETNVNISPLFGIGLGLFFFGFGFMVGL